MQFLNSLCYLILHNKQIVTHVFELFIRKSEFILTTVENPNGNSIIPNGLLHLK